MFLIFDRIIIFVCAIMMSQVLYGQAEIIKDINTQQTVRKNPYGFTEYNGLVYFGATEATGSAKIFVTDGTESGTQILFDGSPRQFTVSGDNLFIDMYTPSFGRELWKTDGTQVGTVLVKDIRPGVFNSAIDDMIDVNGTLYFSADDGANGTELWKSDGTETGTIMIKDIFPGLLGSDPASSHPAQFVEYNDKLYFFAFYAFGEKSLWESDGTLAGTFKITNLNFSYDHHNSPNNTFLVKSDNLLFFNARDNDHGAELWRSDGTTVGTFMLKDLNTSPVGSTTWDSNPLTLVDVNGTLFFQATLGTGADYSLWKSDGTVSGTVEIVNIWTNSTPFWNRNRSLTNFNGNLYFVGSDFQTGHELWKSDGTASGTVLVKDINLLSVPGQANTSSGPEQLTVLDNLLYFSVWNGTAEYLYQTDGTSSETIVVDDLNSTHNIQTPLNITVANGEVYFVSDDDGDITNGPVGDALWSTRVSSLSINETNFFDDFVFFPNPVEEFLYVKGLDLNLSDNVSVLNSIGQEVDVIFSSSGANVSHLSSGLYFIIIDYSETINYSKFIKK